MRRAASAGCGAAGKQREQVDARAVRVVDRRVPHPPERVERRQLTVVSGGGELAPFDAFWGMRYATVHDPDGTGVDLFAPLPGGAAAG